MRPVLILQPIHNSSADILKNFALSRPLSHDQLHFLDQHQKQMSSDVFDPVLKYYIQSNKVNKNKFHGTFLLPHEEMNFEAIQQLKKRILLSLSEKNTGVTLSITQKQFLQFKEVGINELIFWHGNQFLTGAPFYPGGIPPLIYFQWGNLFGIVKYVVLSGEKALKANLLIYIEDLHDRKLEQCVADYNAKLKSELELQNNLLYENKIEQDSFKHFLIKP